MYSKDTGKDQMLMTMERALTSGQKAGFFFLGFLGGIVGILGEDNVPSASYTYVVTGAYDNFGGKVSIGAEEYLSRINIKVYEGDENGNLVFEGGAAECLAWADGYCGDC